MASVDSERKLMIIDRSSLQDFAFTFQRGFWLSYPGWWNGIFQMWNPDICLLATFRLIFLFGVSILVGPAHYDNELDSLLVSLQCGVLKIEPFFVDFILDVWEQIEETFMHQDPVADTPEHWLLLPEPTFVISNLWQAPWGNVQHRQKLFTRHVNQIILLVIFLILFHETWPGVIKIALVGNSRSSHFSRSWCLDGGAIWWKGLHYWWLKGIFLAVSGNIISVSVSVAILISCVHPSSWLLDTLV